MFNHKKVQQVLTIILEGLIYLSFLMPFIFINGSIFPFIVGKILYFQVIVQLMVAVYAVLLIVNFKQFRPKKNLLFYWFGFYAVTLFLSAVFGVDFRRSFWSNFERMTGVFLVFHCIIYSFIVSVIFNDENKIKRAIKVLLSVSLLQVGVVLAQYVKPGVYLYDNVGGRVWGTLGNSIYIGSYFLFHIFFAAYLAFKEKKQFWQIIYLSIAILEGYLIVHSKSSRGATLALLFSAIFIIFCYAILAKNKKIRIAAISLVILGAMSVSGIFIFRNTEVVKQIPYSEKITSLTEGTGRTRMIAWEIAWYAFKERPVLGWGLENFYYVFNKYYNPESLRYSYYETWFDRSHSIIFDTLSSGGTVGFISYFGLFAVAEFLLFLAWKKGRADKHAVIFFTAIFSTYLIQILFVFDHPSSYLLVYFTFGLLMSLIAGQREESEPRYEFSGTVLFLISIAVLVAFCIVFFSTSVKTYKAATGIISAESAFVNNFKVGLQEYRDILQMKTPFINDMRSVMAKRLSQVNPDFVAKNPEYQEALLFARGELLKQANVGDIDVYNYLVLAQIDMIMAMFDGKYHDSAEAFFAKARELSPKRQQIYFTWAREKMIRGDKNGAISLLEEAYSFYPTIGDSNWYLGLAYEQVGEHELAWKYMMRAVEIPYSWKAAEEMYFVLDLGERLKKYAELPKIYEGAVSRWPSAELYVKLGNAYARLNQKTEAMDAYLQAERMNPDIFKKK